MSNRIWVRNYNPGWGSHLPVLANVLDKTEGPVLELGMGVFSTPFLHSMCESRKRLLVSYEENPYYVERHQTFANDNHKIILAENMDDAKIDDFKWSVVLVDHSALRRRIEAIRVAYIAQYVVLHDSDPPDPEHYGYPDKPFFFDVYPHYKYRFDFTRMIPNTTVLSNFIDVSDLKI
ncbi:MAG TPA: hypothetical protein VFI61_02330 [Patescibacteria group bacterium]|nr:hypothetical protein [Patescibacteria group bacterium]